MDGHGHDKAENVQQGDSLHEFLSKITNISRLTTEIATHFGWASYVYFEILLSSPQSLKISIVNKFLLLIRDFSFFSNRFT